MLIKQKHLEQIKKGEISLMFRKWKKKLVKKGSLIKTSIGQIKIININEISSKDINLKEASEAGYKNLSDLMEVLNSKQGKLFKILVRYHSEDPRIKLRNKSYLSEEDFEQIKIKLQRFDKYSKQGEWTIKILNTILENPKLKSAELATIVNKDKTWLKSNIRKLKNLGLTISHEIGYSISPLGKVYLERLNKS